LFCICLASVSVQAQHLDLALYGGEMSYKEHFRSGPHIYKPSYNTQGASFALSLQGKYRFGSGFFAGIDLTHSRLVFDRTLTFATPTSPTGLVPVNSKIYYANSLFNAAITAGYSIHIHRSGIDIGAMGGYIHNSPMGKKSTADYKKFYYPETHGYNVGLTLEYHYRFTNHIEAGLQADGFYMNAQSDGVGRYEMFCFPVMLGLHYRF